MAEPWDLQTWLSLQPPAESNTRVLGQLVTRKGIKNAVVHSVLRIAWSRFGLVRMIDLDDRTIEFEFDSVHDKDQVMDMAPWSVHGHSLCLKECERNTAIEEIKFNLMQVWIQVYGLNMDMLNA